MGSIKPTGINSRSPCDSDRIYLNKLQAFSQTAFSQDGSNADEGLKKTLIFIKEILQADCVVLGEVVTPDERGLIKGIIDNQFCNTDIDGIRAWTLTALANDINVFSDGDDGAREETGVLLDDFGFMSGASVPVWSETGSRGLLGVYYSAGGTVGESRVLFLQSVSHVISYFLQSRDFLSKVNLKKANLTKAKHILEAKREWEGTVDALRHLVAVLDEEAKIIRVNRTIQYWDIGSVDSQSGKHAETVIAALSGGAVQEKYSDWDEIWRCFVKFHHIEWEADNAAAGKVLRFTMRKINQSQDGMARRRHQGYAVLLVEDVTQIKTAEKKLRKYTRRLEGKVKRRNLQLEQLNKRLNLELNEHKKNKAALLRSEERYAKLFHRSLSGICQLEGECIRYCNNQFYEIFRYPCDMLTNMVFIDLFHDEDKDCVRSLFARLDDAHDVQPGSVVARARDRAGSIKWLVVKPDYIDVARTRNIIVNVIDVTRQKSVELSLRQSEKRLQKLSRQLLNAQEVERKRLALELHDGLLQSLSSIKYIIEDITRGIGCSTGTDYQARLVSVVETIRNTIDETRRMAMDLRPSTLDDLGVIYTINWFCGKYQETYRHIAIEKEIRINENEIIDGRKTAIYRIVQEALNNVAKHSGADTVRIALRRIDNDFIQLVISDNGCGIPDTVKSLSANGSIGLSGMLERVELTGGIFLLSDNRPSGVTIDICWPDVRHNSVS